MTASVVPFSAVARLDLAVALADAQGQLAPSSRRMYRIDAEQFAAWMLERGLTPKTLTRSDVIAYRAYLQETYRKATAERKLVVARRLLEELVIGEVLAKSPAYKIKGFELDDETPHVVLTEQEGQALLDVIAIGTLKGLRDYVVILLLLRTGIRRSEAAQLAISDVSTDQGHYVAVIQHGKGDRRRTVKLPVDVWREIDGYIQALKDYHAQRHEEQEAVLVPNLDEEIRRRELLHALEQQHTMAASDPLFVSFRRGDHPTRRAMGDKAIETQVKAYAARVPGLERLTPHGLRASFITLTLENGAQLYQVQYAAGHKHPKTTQRYHGRKTNLDDNAVDYLKLQRRSAAHVHQDGK
ncbi:MAG TPA: tyrosine-type recombinase/integrase [Ktedonobacteraceae bacterium]